MNTATENIEPVWIGKLEQLVNHALTLDEETLERLAELEGKVIAFQFINTQLILYISPQKNGLKFTVEHDAKPNVLIKGTPINFLAMMAANKDKVNTMPADMEIVGDISLAQRFQHIMQDVELDLEEPLSKWVGDTAAFHIGRFFRNTRRFAANTGKTLAMDVSEYLRFENEMLPDDLLVKEFCQNVDTLREDVDRLTQRLQRLETKINNNNGKH